MKSTLTQEIDEIYLGECDFARDKSGFLEKYIPLKQTMLSTTDERFNIYKQMARASRKEMRSYYYKKFLDDTKISVEEKMEYIEVMKINHPSLLSDYEKLDVNLRDISLEMMFSIKRKMEKLRMMKIENLTARSDYEKLVAERAELWEKVQKYEMKLDDGFTDVNLRAISLRMKIKEQFCAVLNLVSLIKEETLKFKKFVDEKNRS